MDLDGVVIGTRQGAGMIPQTGVLLAGPAGPSSFVMWTGGGAGTDDALQLWTESGDLVRTFGRMGAGPGEISRVTALARGCEDGITVADGNRLIPFDSAGDAVLTWALPLESFIAGVSCGDEDTWVLSALGGNGADRPHILHTFHGNTQTLVARSSLHAQSGSRGSIDVGWRRFIDRTRSGGYVAVSTDYRFEVLDEEFTVVDRFVRRPDGWPVDVAAFNSDRDAGGVARPKYRVVDAMVDSDGMLWVASHVPDPDWRDRLVPWERYPEYMVPGGLDGGYDSVVEIIDLQSAAVIQSFRMDERVRAFALPGRVLIYAGDTPFPSYRLVDLRE